MPGRLLGLFYMSKRMSYRRLFWALPSFFWWTFWRRPKTVTSYKCQHISDLCAFPRCVLYIVQWNLTNYRKRGLFVYLNSFLDIFLLKTTILHFNGWRCISKFGLLQLKHMFSLLSIWQWVLRCLGASCTIKCHFSIWESVVVCLWTTILVRASCLCFMTGYDGLWRQSLSR